MVITPDCTMAPQNVFCKGSCAFCQFIQHRVNGTYKKVPGYYHKFWTWYFSNKRPYKKKKKKKEKE